MTLENSGVAAAEYRGRGALRRLTSGALEYMLWTKSFHLIFLVTCFAGLLYLPRLFVYHAMSDDVIGIERTRALRGVADACFMTP